MSSLMLMPLYPINDAQQEQHHEAKADQFGIPGYQVHHGFFSL
jgi:hypothetical protein